MSFDEKLRVLRNTIRSTSKSDLVFRIATDFRKCENVSFPDIAQKGLLPWDLLTLLKFTLLYAGQNNKIKSLDSVRYANLVNLINELDSVYRGMLIKSDEYEKHYAFLRLTACQQFWFQNELNMSIISKCYFIFSSLREESVTNTQFKNEHSISVQRFFNLLAFVWGWALKNTDAIIFNPVLCLDRTNYEKHEINYFFNLVSISLDRSSRNKLQERAKVKSDFLQFGEESPFVYLPFIKISKHQYVVFSKKIIEVALEKYVYSFIRQSRDDKMIREVSVAYENYINEILKSSDVCYIKESDMIDVYGGKKTDFAIIDESCTLLVEAKISEMRESAKVNPKKIILIKELKDNVIKGVIQGYEYANYLLKSKKCKNNKFVLFVVTYSELYLGSPHSAWEEFLKETVTDYLNKNNININIMPPDHIFIMSVDEFSIFMSAIVERKMSIGDLLSKIIEKNSNIYTASFAFKMHLSEYSPVKYVPFIVKNFEMFFENAISTIKKD